MKLLTNMAACAAIAAVLAACKDGDGTDKSLTRTETTTAVEIGVRSGGQNEGSANVGGEVTITLRRSVKKEFAPVEGTNEKAPDARDGIDVDGLKVQDVGIDLRMNASRLQTTGPMVIVATGFDGRVLSRSEHTWVRFGQTLVLANQYQLDQWKASLPEGVPVADVELEVKIGFVPVDGGNFAVATSTYRQMPMTSGAAYREFDCREEFGPRTTADRTCQPR